MAKSSMQELIDWLDPSFSSVIDKAKELLEKEKQQITDKKEFSNSLTMQKKLYYHLWKQLKKTWSQQVKPMNMKKGLAIVLLLFG